MKHIKQKFRFEKTIIEKENKEVILKSSPLRLSEKIKRDIDKPIYAQVGDNKIVETFYYNNSGEHFYIPEPDPIILYFHLSQAFYRDIKNHRKELFKQLRTNEITENVKGNLYNYFGFCNGFIIFLFTSIEAFMNKIIPEDYIHEEDRSKKYTAQYNKSQIERHIQFETKIKIVVPDATKKDFSAFNSKALEHIKNLRKFRDMIVHTKTISEKSNSSYEYLFKEGLDFKYEETLLAVRDYINFYEPNYVMECDCGEDF